MARTLWIQDSTDQILKDLKKRLNFKSMDGLLNHLAIEQGKVGSSVLPATFENVFKDDRPVIITGASGSGKTRTMRTLLERRQPPIFVFDVSNEYSDFAEVDPGMIYNPEFWKKHDQRVRVVPKGGEIASVGQAKGYFQFLNATKVNGTYSGWTLIFEECHRFVNDPELKILVLEARKFFKLVLLSAETEPLKDACPILRPMAFDAKLAGRS